MVRHVLVLGIIVLFTAPTVAAAPPGIRPALAAFIDGRYGAAEDILRKLLRQPATDQGQICYLLGRVNAWEGDVKAAFDWFVKAVEADSASADYQYRLGQMYGAKAQEANIFRKPGHARGARKAFEKAVRLDPDHLAARTALMEYHLYAPGFLGGSREKALEQADEIKSRDLTEGHLAWGLIHAEEKAQAKREGAYLAAVESANDDVRPVISLAALYLRTGRRPEAVRVYETYLRSYSDHALVLRRLSDQYRLEKENEKAFEAARRSLEVAMDSLATLAADSNPTVQSFENALAAQSNRIHALYEIGKFSALTGMKVDPGLESLTANLRLLPQRWRASRVRSYYRLGRIHLRRGERDLARDAYRQVLKLDKEHKGARKALEELD